MQISFNFTGRTSGARISIIQRNTGKSIVDDGSPSDATALTTTTFRELYSDSILWTAERPYDDASAWLYAVDTLLQRAAGQRPDLLHRLGSICVSGTSASCLIVDSKDGGKVTRSPCMYDYDVLTRPSGSNAQRQDETNIYGLRAMNLLDKHAPPKHTSRARTGSLAKLLRWNEERPLSSGERVSHQADYVALHLLHNPKKCGSGMLQNQYSVTSDWHNCLKLGYDVQSLQWPKWLVSCLEDAGMRDPLAVLPSRVVSPGEVIGPVSSHVASKYGILTDSVVVGGTTDSNAAFFAAVGGTRPQFGTAVTSLGSTLAIKQLSKTFVEDADRGVYSHRFPLHEVKELNRTTDNVAKHPHSAWLIGGASNVGCRILRHEGFSNEELKELSKEINPSVSSPFNYYPLTKRGERFPVADSAREPMLEPKPESRKEYLHGILQGISNVERLGFQVLSELGASPSYPHVVWSCGGGANNDMWLVMREVILTESFGQPTQVKRAANTEASYGAAILAASTFEK